MDVWRDALESDVVLLEGLFEDVTAFIVEDVEFCSISVGLELRIPSPTKNHPRPRH